MRSSKPSPMQFIFGIIALGLLLGGRKVGRTYNEMNVIVYFGFIPFTWVTMVDYLVDWHWFKIGFTICCLLIWWQTPNFSKMCDNVFKKCVRFLKKFNQYGSNYVSTSVWICVAVPLMVYLVLGWLTIMKYNGQPII